MTTRQDAEGFVWFASDLAAKQIEHLAQLGRIIDDSFLPANLSPKRGMTADELDREFANWHKSRK